MPTINTFLAALFTAGIAAAGGVDSLLEKTGQRATAFAEQFPSVACVERVVQMKFAPGPKVLNRRESTFDYLILLNTGDGDFTFEESRLEKGKNAKEPSQPLLSTTGFAVMLLVFHPHFQASYQFEPAETEVAGGRTWQKVKFEHIPGRPTPTVLEVRGREYPIAWRGTAWIDPASGIVGRIRTEIKDPLEDIGLQALTSEVEYAPDALTSSEWLPRRAVIEAHTRHQHWRNTHEFSSYRRFDVSADSKVQELKEK
jgi:hypothetical protein